MIPSPGILSVSDGPQALNGYQARQQFYQQTPFKMTPPSDAQEKEYRDLALREKRVTMLGFTFGGVPIDADHEEHLKKQHQPAANCAKTERKPGDKWTLVEGRQGPRAVKVIEDSGTDDNWISPRHLQVLGIPSTEIDPTGHRLINGEILVTTRCARLPLRCKGDRTIEERFLVAPENTPIEIAVGVRFMATHPDAFWNEPPPPGKMLLAVQTRVKKEERERIESARARADELARELAIKRRQKIEASAAASSRSMSWSTLASTGSEAASKTASETEKQG